MCPAAREPCSCRDTAIASKPATTDTQVCPQGGTFNAPFDSPHKFWDLHDPPEMPCPNRGATCTGLVRALAQPREACDADHQGRSVLGVATARLQVARWHAGSVRSSAASASLPCSWYVRSRPRATRSVHRAGLPRDYSPRSGARRLGRQPSTRPPTQQTVRAKRPRDPASCPTPLRTLPST